ncbi:flavin reductase family protein [Sphingobium sp.]|uniref:flavin reductase family protein n=1 Tax=Sphingobium sp. TaxID=1912891 RepID=UPI003B3ABCE9
MSELITDFKSAMRRLTTTVSVVSCALDGVRHGMTATAVTSVCVDPPSLLVCVNRSASMHIPMTKAGVFCVNLLASGQVDVGLAFGGGSTGENRFAVGVWRNSEEGTPYLQHAQANIFCRLYRSIDYCTHSIFIAEVVKASSIATVSPLLYQDGKFVQMEDLTKPFASEAG